jgi:hypothetical protein
VQRLEGRVSAAAYEGTRDGQWCIEPLAMRVSGELPVLRLDVVDALKLKAIAVVEGQPDGRTIAPELDRTALQEAHEFLEIVHVIAADFNVQQHMIEASIEVSDYISPALLVELDKVVAFAGGNRVVALAAINGVVAGPKVDNIVSLTSSEVIITTKPIKRIVAAASPMGVVTLSAEIQSRVMG